MSNMAAHRSKFCSFYFIAGLLVLTLAVLNLASRGSNATHVTGRVVSYELPENARKWLKDKLSNLPVRYERNFRLFQRQALLTVEEAVAKFDLHDLVDHLAANVGPHSVVWIRNLPTDPHVPMCPVPNGDNDKRGIKAFCVEKKTQIAEALLVAFGQLAGGNPVGYSFESTYSHPLIHNSCPHPHGSALSGGKDQHWHSDMAYVHPRLMPDVLGLTCIREGHDKQVTTDLLDVRDIFKYLSLGNQQILSQPRFYIKCPVWADDAFVAVASGEDRSRPLLDTSKRLAPSISMHVDWDNVVAKDMEADVALQALKLAIVAAEKKDMSSLHLVPGDLVLFNNRRNLHRRSRTLQKPRYDGLDRTILRAYFSKSSPQTIVRKHGF